MGKGWIPELPLYGASLAPLFYMAWGLGANDAANSRNCVVGAGIYSARKALYTFALFSAVTLSAVLFWVRKAEGVELSSRLLIPVHLLSAFLRSQRHGQHHGGFTPPGA